MISLASVVILLTILAIAPLLGLKILMVLASIALGIVAFYAGIGAAISGPDLLQPGFQTPFYVVAIVIGAPFVLGVLSIAFLLMALIITPTTPFLWYMGVAAGLIVGLALFLCTPRS